MHKNSADTLPPFAQGRNLGNSRWYMGNLMTFLVNSQQTGGAFSMTDYVSKPGNEPPAHVHEREDEFFYLLEGRIDAYVGGEVFLRVRMKECTSQNPFRIRSILSLHICGC